MAVFVSIAVKRHHVHGNSYKGKHLIGCLKFRGSVLNILVGLGSIQADMELEKELRGLHLDMQATGSKLRHWTWLVKPQSLLPQ